MIFLLRMNLRKNYILSFKFLVAFIFLFIIGGSDLFSQYFGRNKPSYRSFDYQLYQAPNFDIYHYFEHDSIVNNIANTYEKWYKRHQKVFKDTFPERNPVLIYENHPDFQQTVAVGSQIGVGTHGVTEALRRRIVMPVLHTNAQTDHVIGHELVHAFQFRSMFEKDELGLNSMRNLPLWLVEGMAEYFSIGSVDAHTAMIMRDVVHQEKFPSLKDMTRSMQQYNPYRFGHSFVAFFGRTWGDDQIAPLFSQTARFGYQRAISRVVGLNAETVGGLWKSSMDAHFEQYYQDSTRHETIGESVITDENGGHINMAPSLSPDGNYIAFFSERDLVSLDLFLADAKTGEIIQKLTSTTRNADVDGFNFFESKATWSPEGDKIAYVIVKRGRNKIVIADVDRPRRTEEIVISGVPALNNPSWSPDGKKIAFSGLAGGEQNLYMYNLEDEEVIQLTDDVHSYVHPSWSEDGKHLAFSTDKPQTSQTRGNPEFHFNLGVMDMTNDKNSTSILDVFPGAENLNPLFASDDEGLYFLSNSDGFRNLYYYSFDEGDVFRMTDFYTGISGMTELTPAICVERETGKLAYTHYQDGKYFIHMAQNPTEFLMKQVDPFELDFSAATLPPLERQETDIVDNYLREEELDEEVFPVDSFDVKPFKRDFSLTYIGNTGVGVATSRYGTGMQGAVSMQFSDITGENQLFTTVAVDGEIYDFGAQVGYINQERRFNWGAMASHIPYPFATMRWQRDTLITDEGEPVEVNNLQYLIQRLFEDQVGAFAYYPFSVSRRLEVGGTLAWYYYRIDAINNYYYQGMKVGEEREQLESPPGFSLQRMNIAFVEDNSIFGMASPMAGQRYRADVERIFGEVDLYSITLDYRRYFNIRPFTVAFRTTHYGRYGLTAEDEQLFRPQYLGYMGYVRGYDYNSLYQIQESLPEDFHYEQLMGSRVILSGLEIRLPFTGPERLALISSGMFFTEANLFLDAGVAWSKGQSVTLDPDERGPDNRFPVFSVGASARINLFGAMILEPFYAFPFQTEGISAGVAGLNFIPGW